MTTPGHTTQAPSTTAPVLPAAMGSAAPSSPSQSPPQIRRVVFSQDPHVVWDWEDLKRRTSTIDDVMSRTSTIDAPLPVARAAPEYTDYATLLCEICGSGDREDDLLLCDGCSRGHHTFCLRPNVTQVPVGPWFCPVCAPPPAMEPESFPPNQTDEHDKGEQEALAKEPESLTFNQTDEQDKGEQDAQAAETGLSQGFPSNQTDEQDKGEQDAQAAETGLSQGFPSNQMDEQDKGEQDAQAGKTGLSQGFPPNQTDKQDKGDPHAQAAETGLSQVDTTIEASNERETGSSTIEKRNGQKKKRVHGGHGPNKKNLKADDDSIEFLDKFLANRAFPKGFKIEGEFESPPFIEISRFYVTYDEFYDSFKARGLVANSVMALWSNQFNVDQRQKFKDGKTSDRKFAFSQIVTDYLSVDSASFDSEEACKKIYTKIDETFPFNDMDLILNFSATTMKYGFLKQNVSDDFKWSFPPGYPKQKNLIDCGMYTMDFMEAWNGKEMVASYLEKGTVLDYRKHAAQLLLESEHNIVKLDDFVKKYKGKKT